MQMNSQKRESTEITLLSLLLARKRPCTLTQLTKDYYEMEGGHIPWRELGYHSLLNLLQSMPKSVFIEHRDNMILVSGIASDKSKHVSKLVAGQKEQKHIVGRRLYKPSHYYPHTGHQRIHIPAEILTMIISYVNENPDGVNKDYVLKEVQSHMPYTQISMSDMEEQLQKLSHKIYQSYNRIFPARSKLNNVDSSAVVVTASGNEDSDDMIDDGEEDDFQFVPAGYTPDPSQTKANAKNKSTSNFIKESVSKCQDQVPQAKATDHTSRIKTNQMNSCNSHNYIYDNADQFKMELNNNLDNENYFDGKNVDILINERVKFRLEKLIQNHPDGIWCADLPEKYLEEYKVSLNYTELGFNSVREFASQLPETFHCVQPYDTGDFMLYYAKRDIPLNKSKEKQKHVTLAEMHNIYMKDDEDALPLSLTLDTCKKLIPDGIVTIGECVGQLSVADLLNVERPYIEVVVVEVFSPSFFWIQLRKKQRAFTHFMDDLHHFYSKKQEDYVIPPVVLEKGLNCACIYNEVWHRGIIMTVNPDLQVTVMFYDYGTLKTYPSDSVFYLHRMFSSIPAQAIPCGLINTRPYKGTKWSRSVTHHFAVRTSQIPLIATIASINSEDNSLMVTLTDTLGEEDVHINDWLVEQKLAEHGKMVCMRNRNFPFRYYLECQERFKQKCETSKASKTVEPKEFKKSAHSGNYSKNAVALYNLKSSSTNDLRRASSKNVHRSDIPIEESRDSTLNVTEKAPRALKSLYEKLLDLKRNSTSSNDSGKKERDYTAEGNEFSSSDSAANDTAERKFDKESFNNNVESNNNKCDVFTSDLTNSNHKEINEYVEYDILKKFNNIPRTYANHFSMHNSEDELEEPCIGSLTDRNNKPCELEEIDWSTIRKNMAGKKQSLPQQHAIKKTYKSIPTERENIPLAESSFLNVVRNSVYCASRDEDIHWSPTGNVDKNPDASPAILKNIKKRAASCTKEMTVGIPQKMLELLKGRELAEEPLESSTNASENCINEPLSSCSSQGISSVTADASSYSNDGDTFCTETSQSISGDCASRLENDYVCVTPRTPKHKLLHRLFLMQQRLHDTSELDSDDLSASDLFVSAHKSTNNSNEESKLEDRETYVTLDESISNVSYSEINAKDPSPSSETEDTNLDVIESSVSSASVLAEESVPIQDQSAPTEESISLSTSVSTGEPEVQHETLEEEESIEESIQIEDPLLTEETISSELVPRSESLPLNVIANTPSIPVFNDIDLESDSDEWDLQVSVADMCELLNINRSIGLGNQMEQRSDEDLQIEEINDSNPEDTNIPEKDQKNNVCEVIRSEDQMVNNEKFNGTQRAVLDLEKNLGINDKDNSGPTNTSLVPWKSQGKAKTLIQMLKKVKVMGNHRFH